jgi:molybdate transport system substrate-binding protein
MSLRPILTATITGCMSAIMAGQAARGAEIIVVSPGTVQEMMVVLIPMFERASGHKVSISFEAPSAMLSTIATRQVDVLLSPAELIDDLANKGTVVPGSRVDLARSGVGMAVRAGAPKPDIGSADAFKQSMLAAKSIAYSRGPSGNHFVAVIQSLGIADPMKAKMMLSEGGPVGGLVAKGQVEIGVHQIAELLPIVGIDIVGPFPPELQKMTVYSAGTHVNSTQPEAAKALVDFISSPAAAPVFKAKGMEPI